MYPVFVPTFVPHNLTFPCNISNFRYLQGDDGSGGRDRTYGQLINSQLLYR